MKSFEFKPALLRERNNWTIDSGMLTRNGELFCSLANVQHAQFGDLSVKQTTNAWLDLNTGTAGHRIDCTAPPGDPDREQFLSLSRAILEELSQIKPEMSVSIGVGGAARWSLFLIGVIAALLGLALMGFSGEASPDLFVVALGAGGAFTIFGAVLAWAFRPWSAPKKMIPSDARDHVAARSLNSNPATAEQDGEADEDREG
ncbi:hypothetical protein [Henriciella marina]|uniref:hypothetical protein n=1 Tax=Henriciella marina TaxID=453851 RepID=UPI00035C8260|nr:hypothetical protein [Henriciella marina]